MKAKDVCSSMADWFVLDSGSPAECSDNKKNERDSCASEEERHREVDNRTGS